MYPPATVVVFVPVPAAGSPKQARQVKPRFPTHPVRTKEPPRLPRQEIPRHQIEALRSAARAMLDANRPLLAERR